MSKKSFLAASFASALLSLGLYACLEAQAKNDAPVANGPTYPVSSDALGGSERYLTHVSTDKPIYKIGETVYVRAVTLKAGSREPWPAGAWIPVQIKGPKGDVIASGGANSQEGVTAFAWPVPEGLAGGEYSVTVTPTGMSPAERKFDVRVYRAPRLKSQIQFARDGYGPGDSVFATLHTERAEGGIPKGAKVTVSARVDDREVYSGTSKVDLGGNATTSFQLPKDIERGEGTLAMTIEDGGVVETATKTIPILLQTVDVALYPEGGDLVVGVPCRVYVEARTPAKKPADIEAAVVDESGAALATFKTEHEGRGKVTFTPAKGHSYKLKILAPTGIKTTYALPAAKTEGAVLAAALEVIPKNGAALFKVGANRTGTYTLTLSQRETQLSSKAVTIGSGGFFNRGAAVGELFDVSLSLPSNVDGVLIATLWDADHKPLAERLVFRQPAKSVVVTLKADRDSYVPGGKVKIDVATTDAKGTPLSATVGITVTDDSVLEMIEKREQAPRLPAMVFLEPEVKELADAHVYLDPKNPKAPLAVDLLLATQGWRRFALVNLVTFIETHGDAARRALAIVVPPPRPVARFEEAGEMFAPEAPMAAAEGAAMPAMARPMPAAPPAMAPRAPGRAPARAAADRPAPAPKAKDAQQPPAKVAAAPMAENKMMAKPQLAKEDVARAARGAKKREMDERLFAADDEAPQAGNFAYVREYAHLARPDRKPNDRIDFAETLYWNAGLRTDAKTGKGSFTFDMSDAVTAFRVAADGFTPAGAIGMETASVKSVQPFYIEPKVPLQVTSKDVIQLPIALVNGTATDINDVHLDVTAAKGIPVGDAVSKILVKANSRGRRLLEIAVGSFVGTSDIVAAADAGGYSDKVTRTLDVRPLGFPVTIAKSGMVDARAAAKMEIEVPTSMVQGSLVTEVTLFPTPLGNLTQALTRLMQEPNGCFEQTSSSNYPLTMAQQYFTTHQGVDPEIIKRSGELLQRGYQRLASFECQDKGYEWFGGSSPGHEALTAYGIMEFADMKRAKLAMVDTKMVERTRDWLFKRKDGNGGFQRNQRALDSFGGAPAETTNAYITWALAEAGEQGLEKEAAALKKIASRSNDSYVVALAANVSAAAGDKETARALMQKLAAKQNTDGAVDGAHTSITQSGGSALLIETTALATLAWLKDPAHAGEVEKAIRFLTAQCEGGRFSSTQATVLALKAIVAYDGARARPKGGGSLQLLLDGKPVADAVAFTSETEGVLTLPSLAAVLTAGKHVVEVRMSAGAAMPYAASFKYHAVTPASSDKTKLALDTKLSDAVVTEGKTTEIRVDVANITDAAVPMPVAIVGVPGGLEVRHDQLKELVKSGKIAAYEVLGREVVLYWRQLKAKEKVSLPISVVAAVPGKYTAPASRVYEYYTDEFKRWTAGVTATVTPLAAP
ncbi:MAG: A-macroglobulin complement component [Deltaproteobacteria bacterium]|nr:A-macroglobulin complement component [Deltaproteobacteria bacterium]